MTPNEFKAWFEGYSEAIDGAPTKEQWERIVAQVAGLSEYTEMAPGYFKQATRTL